jgi:predicted ATPase
VIAGALARSPVVTLVGPGGIGMTRLALAAAQPSVVGRGGAWFVDLATITSSSDVRRAFADTLGVKEHPGRTLTPSIVLSLQSLSALLVLDNCEQVIDGATALARAIAQGCPMVQVLATSREALASTTNNSFRLARLTRPGPRPSCSRSGRGRSA